MEQWLEKFIELAQQYRALGTVIGLSLPFIESFLPFLPLFALVFANPTASGFWCGFLLSWVGSSVGSSAVFLVVRNYGHAIIYRFLTERTRVEQMAHVLEINVLE